MAEIRTIYAVEPGWSDEPPVLVSVEASVTPKQVMIVTGDRINGRGRHTLRAWGYRRKLLERDVFFTAADAIAHFLSDAELDLTRAIASVEHCRTRLDQALELWAQYEPSTSTSGEQP